MAQTQTASQPSANQMGFLDQYLMQVLNQHGFAKLKPDDQKAFFPQFLAEADKRLGIAMMPHITEKMAEEISNLMQKETTPDQWYEFWSANVQNFDALVKKTMESYASEITAAFNM